MCHPPKSVLYPVLKDFWIYNTGKISIRLHCYIIRISSFFLIFKGFVGGACARVCVQ